jgi:Type I restriction-modification system methyltransferase subunit
MSEEASGVPDPELRPGYIVDFVSGQPVRATPEEVDAVQVFSRRLVDDYGYPREHIQTRPQFRVRIRPSDEEKSYPVDIAVFSSERRLEEDLFLVVECKKKNRRDGLAQLKLYLDMSPAEIGVWYNGGDHIYIRKIHHPDGSRTYEPLPNIPRRDQRIEDIGLFKRNELLKPSNLKSVFRDIRNHLAGKVTGITRDEALAQELINVLFCKIYDEVNTGAEEIVRFRSGQGEDPDQVRMRILALFQDVKTEYSDVFPATDQITLDSETISYIVGELQGYCFIEADRDAIGEAFEVFIGPALRGGEGQFFTPRNVVRLVMSMIDPEPGQSIIDPACGSGGFLITALEYIWRKVDQQGQVKGWNEIMIDRRRREVATRFFRGIDKDSFLAKTTKAYMAIMGDGRGGVFCENSLVAPTEWPAQVQEKIQPGTFDVVVTNPPFGSKIKIAGREILCQYDLARTWKRDKQTGHLSITNHLRDDQPPQLLFIERALQLLKPGGHLGIVLPESIFGNPSYEYVITWLESKARIRAVISMPESLFKTSGKGGTHAKTAVVLIENTPPADGEDFDIFFADAKWCGHDSRGNPTIRLNDAGKPEILDDMPTITANYQILMRGEVRPAEARHNHLGFVLKRSQIVRKIYIPRYYNPEILSQLEALKETHNLIPISTLLRNKQISVSTGDEIGKMAYGTGSIPFIRTSDISNWEIKTDPKQGISNEIYEHYRTKQDVKPGDIFMVRDGTYLVGQTCMVTEADAQLIYQSHILKFRLKRGAPITPYLFLAALSSPIVRKQIRSMQFTADIIDSIGNRYLELVLPIPKDEKEQQRIEEETRAVIEGRIALRERMRQIPFMIEPAEEVIAEGQTEAEESL